MSLPASGAINLFSYPKYWAECYGTAPYLPMSRQEMDELGWDSCDIILVTGDAYVDHPSFGMAVIGRFLESQGFRVGIIAQPDWRNTDDFTKLGKPNLFFGITAGNMDSLINRYTADKRIRSEDAYTPYGEAGKRPDRAVIVYSQKCKEAYSDVPLVLGSIEASLRRIAQYDYWSDEVRRSVLIDAAGDILLYGNAERAIAEIAQQLSLGRDISELTDIRGTAVIRKQLPDGWTEVDSSRIDWPSKIGDMVNPYGPNPYEYGHEGGAGEQGGSCSVKDAQTVTNVAANVASGVNGSAEADEVAPEPIKIIPMPLQTRSQLTADNTYVRLPSYEKVKKDPALYAHASRVLHQESNPYNARTLVQKHGTLELWVNPPPIPLETDEMDGVFGLPYQRQPHPSYGDARIPAYEMIRTSVNIMRGCFGGCTFCSITEHEGRIIQSRSHESILQEIEDIKEKVPAFTGSISDLGGPTANMYHLNCKSPEILKRCRRLSCVYPTICTNLKTDHSATTELYRKARAIPGIKRILIASGLRYDLAVKDPEYVKELVTHHVGGYLKIAPEHTEENVLSKMMKPGMGTYDSFKKMFEKYSKEAGKEQYLIPYFIAAHPGCDETDMLNLARWLKKNKFRLDQVQTFYPSPMALATAMYYSGKNPLSKVTYKSGKVQSPKSIDSRRLQKAFLRYHDPKNWGYLRESLVRMGRKDLIGDGENQLIPSDDNAQGRQSPQRKSSQRNPQQRKTGQNNPSQKKSASTRNPRASNQKKPGFSKTGPSGRKGSSPSKPKRRR